MEFPGCAMVISHDRWFLDRIVLILSLLKEIAKLHGLKATTMPMKNFKKKNLVMSTKVQNELNIENSKHKIKKVSDIYCLMYMSDTFLTSMYAYIEK